jgi:ribosomal protein L7/L12
MRAEKASGGGGPDRSVSRKVPSRKPIARAGESLMSLLDQAGRVEVETLLARGEFVPAVRRVRELTGLRLIDAKRAV